MGLHFVQVRPYTYRKSKARHGQREEEMNEQQAAQLLDDVRTALVILAQDGQEDSPLAAFLRASAIRAASDHDSDHAAMLRDSIRQVPA